VGCEWVTLSVNFVQLGERVKVAEASDVQCLSGSCVRTMPKGECLLVGAEAWALQVGLGVLAFLSLVYKRYKVCVAPILCTATLPRLALHARKAVRGSVTVSCVRLLTLPHCHMWQPLRELQERQACFTQSSVSAVVSL
jgi:hypothetical protein